MGSQHLQYKLLNFLSLLFLHSATGSVEEDVALYKSLERALVTDTNIFILQEKFYPYNAIADDVTQIFICQENFTVKSIPDAENKTEGAFIYNEDCDCYVRQPQPDQWNKCTPSIFNYPCNGYYDLMGLSVLDTSKYLSVYMRDLIGFVTAFDPTFYTLVDHFISDNKLNFGGMHYEWTIDLSIDYLPTNPSNDELLDILSALLMWAKYYARTSNISGSTPRLDSDRSFVTDECRSGNGRVIKYTISASDHSIIAIVMMISLNMLIMLIGLYVIQQAFATNTVSKLLESWLESTETMTILFWTTSVVLFVVNLTCLIVDFITSPFVSSYVMRVPLIGFFTLSEICTIHVITKKYRANSNLCSRIVHNYATCNILWFAHRVGNCFIVSIYFIALAPSQTIAAITLCISAIVMYITVIAVGVRLCYSKNCITVLKLLGLVITLIFALVFLITFTLIFVDLIQHGLSASDMGSVILSLAIPSLMLLVSFGVKRYLKDSSSNGYDNEKMPLLQKENMNSQTSI